MDRLSQLRGEAGSSRDSTLDTSSPPSQAFMTANESSSKYYSLSEVDSTFDISPIKDVSLASANIEPEKAITESDQLISNLSPIGKKDFMDGYKIGKQIEAANILSGGVDIFDDNENSYDGDELVIDDNVEIDDKSNPDIKLADSDATLVEQEAVASKDAEVILQIDGKNVDAIDIGNGLYLYRKEGQEELAAVQIIDDDQHQPSFKFLKVRENAEGNLEVYEEIQIEVPNEVPVKEEKVFNKNVSHVPIKDINKVISDTTSNKIAERKSKPQNVKQPAVTVPKEPEIEIIKETQAEAKSEATKKIKFSESRKSPVIGSFTPMTYHSTPKKEGIPLTKTMVDQQLQPSRHSDNIKKTIEVHTDCAKQRNLDPLCKSKDSISDDKIKPALAEKDYSGDKSSVFELGLNSEHLSKGTIDEIDHKQVSEVVDEEKLLINKISDKVAEKENAIIDKIVEKEHSYIGKVADNDNGHIDKMGEKENVHIDNQAVVCNVEITEMKSLDTNKSSTTESLKIDTNKSETQEINKKGLVQEVVPTTGKQVESNTNTLLDKETVNKKCESTQETDKTDNKIENKVFNKPEVESIKTDIKSDISTVDSKSADNLKVVDSEIVVDNQSNKKSIDEVDSKMCIYNVEKQIDQNITETTYVQDIVEKDKIVEDKKKQLKVQPDNCTKALKFEDKKSDIISTKSDDTVKEHSKVESTEKTANKPGDTKEQNMTSTTKVVEKLDIKPILPLKQLNPNQAKKVCKKINIFPASKSNASVAAESSKVEPEAQLAANAEHKDIKTQDIKVPPAQSILQGKNDSVDMKPVSKVVPTTDSKPINNNHAAVPFGKWTEVNRQAFLNKIKESKVPTNSSNGKQIKNSNDLNRRDVLKKIDSQRQSSMASAKAQELKTESQRQSSINAANTQDFGSATRMGVKQEAELAKKTTAVKEIKPAAAEAPILKNSSTVHPAKKPKEETVVKHQVEAVTSSAIDIKIESKRKEINNQDLIDKTIEEIINRPMPAKTPQEPQAQRCYDEIEMKMNELHGKPFIERPVHELPPAQKLAPKTYPKSEYLKTNVNKPSKIPSLVPFNKAQQKSVKENPAEVDSEEEVIEHVPITGDMDLDKKKPTKLVVTDKVPTTEPITHTSVDLSKKEAIITEKDFDKFARRNSISYENCITVNFDGKEPHNVIQSVVQKDVGLKTYSKKDSLQHDSKVISPRKRDIFNANSHPKSALNTKFENTIEDDGKQYQSKVKMAYQTAMTAKRQMERPITIIEDRPVKVVYIDTNTEFITNPASIQGKDLSPAKKTLLSVVSLTTDSQDSDNTLDSIEGEKNIDETKTKTKHQRKQVLTPVETPELELIEPNDLGIGVSPKKKRKTEEKLDKNPKTLVPKKSYLLGRGNTLEDSLSKSYDFTKTSQREPLTQDSSRIAHQNTASAIDSLVKAAELLETQSGNITSKAPDTPTSDGQQNTPVKRGRGRPRKYPLPEGGTPDKAKVPSPQKKPRLIDAKVVKNKYIDDDTSSDDDVIVKENWTMGKINENIVCPICKKLFRSENVVFKHVKHCTGPSPSRSDSENKSPRRFRDSQESESRSYESKSEDMEIDEPEPSHKERTKRKSKDNSQQKAIEKDEVIVIEDTPLKAKPDKKDETKTESKKHLEMKPELKKNIEIKPESNKNTEIKPDSKKNTEIKPEFKKNKEIKPESKKNSEMKPESKKLPKNKGPDKASSLVCEFCGKRFRQLSYLVSHRLQHGKEDGKKPESEPAKSNKPDYTCEVCKKDFRLLHHLVQHRLIHNPSTSSGKVSRKSSSERNDKVSKEQNDSKASKEHKDDKASKEQKVDKAPKEQKDDKAHDDNVSNEENNSRSSEDEKAGFRCEPCDKSFRKLHHLVEHRETHDGINRQRVAIVHNNTEKLPPPPQCEVCKKSFRKLHHLIEHKEQHLETSSEKSDDKSVKSSLSTKDIIHECPLCYMVFPNENSLNKHMVFCQRKKKQSKQKQAAENETVEGETSTVRVDEDKSDQVDDDVTIVTEETVSEKPAHVVTKDVVDDKAENKMEIVEEPVKETAQPVVLNESLKPNVIETEKKEDNKPIEESIKPSPAITEVVPELPKKEKKPDEPESKPKIHETPRKKTPSKEKVTPTVPKRHKPNVPVSVVEEAAPKPTESSDDEEARYMLNPDYKFEDEGKVFMKIRANKRNSLQIERPNSKDLVTRRISLQHPLKVPRLKAKAVQNKIVPSEVPTSVKPVLKAPKPEPVPSTDSDDSDVKYSFPKSTPDKVPAIKAAKSNIQETSAKDSLKKTQRKSLAEKRKSLSSIAKRKSLGKAVGAKHKVKPSPAKQVRKRTAEVEHRCDCGQLFSSAALLARHTSLAHTPPRIRRRRTPPPDPAPRPQPRSAPNPAPRKSNLHAPKTDSRKSSVKSDTSAPPKTQPTKRKSSVKPEPKTPAETRKTPRSNDKTDAKSAPANKLRRHTTPAHKGVPVPEKMRKLMEKSKK